MQNFNNMVTASGIQMDYTASSSVRTLIEEMRDVAEILKELEEALFEPIREMHRWFRGDTSNTGPETVQKMYAKRYKPAVVFQPDCVIVCGEKIFPKMNAIHVLVIRALIETQDEFGICIDRQIENFLRDKGLQPFEREKSKERIRTGIRDGKRFLRIIDGRIGQNKLFVKRIRDKGYLVDNTMRT